jgi:TfoX/Sxy family transcriptional regulator of competence genes
MPSDPSFVDYVTGQMAGAGDIIAKKMFGEYGLYANGIFFGVICDNKLFVKPTEGGRQFIGEVVEAPPYEGAKNSFLIEDQVEDADWLAELVTITVAELPPPKKRT